MPRPRISVRPIEPSGRTWIMSSATPFGAGTDAVLVYMVGSLGDTVITIPALRAVVRGCGEALEETETLQKVQASVASRRPPR